MTYLNWVLLWFEAIARLNINLEKSIIMPIGCVEDIEVLANDLGCSEGTSLQLT